MVERARRLRNWPSRVRAFKTSPWPNYVITVRQRAGGGDERGEPRGIKVVRGALSTRFQQVEGGPEFMGNAAVERRR